MRARDSAFRRMALSIQSRVGCRWAPRPGIRRRESTTATGAKAFGPTTMRINSSALARPRQPTHVRAFNRALLQGATDDRPDAAVHRTPSSLPALSRCNESVSGAICLKYRKIAARSSTAGPGSLQTRRSSAPRSTNSCRRIRRRGPVLRPQHRCGYRFASRSTGPRGAHSALPGQSPATTGSRGRSLSRRGQNGR